MYVSLRELGASGLEDFLPRVSRQAPDAILRQRWRRYPLAEIEVRVCQLI
jgi:hypothetical protein